MATLEAPAPTTPVAGPEGRRDTWLGAAIGVAVLLGLLMPYLIDQYWLGIATEAIIFAIAAMGLNVLIGQAGLVSVGHAGLFGSAAYATSISQSQLGYGFVASGLFAVAVTVAITAMFAVAAVRTTGMYFLMITLASGMLVWGIAQRWSAFTGGENGAISGLRPTGFEEYYEYYWLVLFALLVTCAGLWWFVNSTAGLRVRGARDSAARMTAIGHSPARQRFLAFMVSGGITAAAGVLYAGYWPVVAPSTSHLSASILLMLMVLAGGTGYFLGPVVGALALVTVRAVISAETPRWPMVMGIVLVLVVLFARDGITGIAGRVVRRARPSAERSPR